MAQAFPQHPNLVGGFEPLQMECDAPDLIIEGEVPKELTGVFFRNGPQSTVCAARRLSPLRRRWHGARVLHRQRSSGL